MKTEAYQNAVTIKKMVKAMGELARDFETFVNSDEVPTSERDYQIAKDVTWAKLKAEGKPVTEIKEIIKGRCAEELFRRDKAEIKYKSFIVRLGVLEKQLNGYQSVNRYLDE